MTITTSYFAFESESVGESRRERIMVIWCIALLGLGQQTRGEWSSIKEFINQSGHSLAGEGRMLGILCFLDIISGLSSISMPMHPPDANAPAWDGSDLLAP